MKGLGESWFCRARRIPPTFSSLGRGIACGLEGPSRTSVPPPGSLAGGGDRSGDSIVTTGPVLIRYDEGSKVQIPLEAIYLLDYKGGRLLGTVPSLRGTVGTSRYFGHSPSATSWLTSSSTWIKGRGRIS